MEENSVISEIKIALTSVNGQLSFQLKDSERVGRAIHESIQAELSGDRPDSIVLYPDNLIVDSSRMFVESTSVLL